jgi:hypothetical protein
MSGRTKTFRARGDISSRPRNLKTGACFSYRWFAIVNGGCDAPNVDSHRRNRWSAARRKVWCGPDGRTERRNDQNLGGPGTFRSLGAAHETD